MNVPTDSVSAPSVSARPFLPRVAFFTDSWLEVNGVAHTSRKLTACAQQHGIPWLCVHRSNETCTVQEGSLTRLLLKRGSVALPLDDELKSDLLIWRHWSYTLQIVRAFQPDIIHITGPSDLGQLGAAIAHKLRIPLTASWHTNVHEFAAVRAEKMCRWLPLSLRTRLRYEIERSVLAATMKFYKLARLLLAPNEELAAMLQQRTNRSVHLMPRGVDLDLFSPAKRERPDEIFTLGFVGRLRPEKNVRFLVELEKSLLAAGLKKFQFLIVGDGSERAWLSRHLSHARFAGTLYGEELARAYAAMDLFIFPSHTDTFGNVVLEALASGVPAIVTADGGPKFIIRDGVSGVCVSADQHFSEAVIRLMQDRATHRQMQLAARQRACEFSWESVFENVLAAYRSCLATENLSEDANTFGVTIQPAPQFGIRLITSLRDGS